ncbi:MAG: DUF983 domain-containing protein [Cyclobacteriaceae bacterium]
MNGFKAIVDERCPRCRESKMFVTPPVHWRDFTKMKATCDTCGLRFQVEPGFFIGAMYISYAIIVGIIVVTAITLFNLFNNPDLWVYMAVVIGTTTILLPFIYRYSRVLFLYWFGGVQRMEHQ